MADISVQKKEGADLTWVWAAAAVVAIVGLMAWLLSTQDQASTVAVNPGVADTASETVEAQTVELSAVGAAPDQYVGRNVRIEGLPVTVALGDRGFWVNVPDASPLLVLVDPAVPDASWIGAGSPRTVVGTVRPVTEADVNSWVQANHITGEARAQAAFATHYLLVTEAVP